MVKGGSRLAAGGERGKMCRTKHKNDFEKDLPVPYFCYTWFQFRSKDDAFKHAIKQAA